jgi:hypothetical protein
MEKHILYSVIVLVIAALAAWNVNFKSQSKNLAVISLSNIEILVAFGEEDDTKKGTKAKCEETVETYTTTSSGWTWNAGANVWLFNGSVTNTTPPSYEKRTVKSTWDGCKSSGNTPCSDAEC